MKLVLTLAIVLASLFAYAQEVRIHVKLIDVKTKKPLQAYLFEYDGSDMDTVQVINNSFSFSRKLDYPKLLRLSVLTAQEEPVSAIRFFAEPGEMNLTLVARGAEIHTIHYDSKSQNLYEDFHKQFNPLSKLWQFSARETHSTELSVAEIEIHKSVIANIEKIQMQLAEDFILKNTDNTVGAYVFAHHMRNAKPSRQDSLYKLFNPALYNTRYLKGMKERVIASTTLLPGKPAPSFETVSSERKPVTLADFKGKYLVIDFWGSWCAPCIEGFPAMKTYYEKYKSKIEFISIACRDTPDAWTKALKKYNLPWIQIFNGKDSEDLTGKYAIDTYPTKVLIDPAGNLIKIFKGEGEDFYKQLDDLFK